MGDGQTGRRGDARQARPALTANAAAASALATRGGLGWARATCSDAACSTLSTHPSVSTDLSSIRGERVLAFGAPSPLGAQGVRNPGRDARTQRGEPAGAWLCQPAGGHVPIPCSTHGWVVPAQAGENCVPPACAGRLAPPDVSVRVRRGDDRGRDERRMAASASHDARSPRAHRSVAQWSSPQRGASSRGVVTGRAHSAGRTAPDALQVALLARVGGLHVATGSTPAVPEVAVCSPEAGRGIERVMPRRVFALALPLCDITGTLEPVCPMVSSLDAGSGAGWRVVRNGRAGVSDTSGRAGRSPAVRNAIKASLAQPEGRGRGTSLRTALQRNELLLLERYDTREKDWVIGGYVEWHMRVDDTLTLRDVGTVGEIPHAGVAKHLIGELMHQLSPAV